jgi:hypothetical protein
LAVLKIVVPLYKIGIKNIVLRIKMADMKRKIENTLLEWKNNDKALPFLIFCGFMMFFATLEAQIRYSYDESGNRVRRYITKSLVIDTVYIDTIYNKASNDSVQDATQEEDLFEKKDAFEVLVYPNPTIGMLEVELPGLKTNQNTHLYLYSQTGILVKQMDRLQRRQSVDISNQPAGIYILRITVDNKAVLRKIIKAEY